MPATYCPEKGDRRVTFFCDERYLVHTISDVAIKYSKGRMIRQQPEGHDTFASGDSCFCAAKVAPVALSTITASVNWLSDKRYLCVSINHQIGPLSRKEQKSL